MCQNNTDPAVNITVAVIHMHDQRKDRHDERLKFRIQTHLHHFADLGNDRIFFHKLLFDNTGKALTFLLMKIEILFHLHIGTGTISHEQRHGVDLIILKSISVFFADHLHDRLHGIHDIRIRRAFNVAVIKQDGIEIMLYIFRTCFNILLHEDTVILQILQIIQQSRKQLYLRQLV